MGYGFVLLIYFIVTFVFSVVVAFFSASITYFVANEKKRARKIIAAVVAPFIGLYSFFFVGLFSLLVISEKKGIDVGFGDYWYVPISDSCRLAFIDMPEQAFIACNGDGTITDYVERLGQKKDKVYGETYEGKYFVFNTASNTLDFISNKEDWLSLQKPDTAALTTALDFYGKRRDEVAGFELNIALAATLLVSLLNIYAVSWLILKIGAGKQFSNS